MRDEKRPEENIVFPRNLHSDPQHSVLHGAQIGAPYVLGDVIVEPGLQSIRRAGESIRVERRHMAVLNELVRQAGATVSRDGLLEAGWGEQALSDESLTEAISRLRRALGDRASAPQYIQTVPKRGYRLIVTPRALPAPDEAGESARECAPPAGSPVRWGLLEGAVSWRLPLPGRTQVGLPSALLAVAIVLSVIGGVDRFKGLSEPAVLAALMDPNPAWLDIDPDF